jgi:hypothetical protein
MKPSNTTSSNSTMKSSNSSAPATAPTKK